jgi:hypothetical protein
MIRIAFAVIISAFSLRQRNCCLLHDQTTNNGAKSHQAKAQRPTNCIDLNGVPQISARIAGAEPAPVVKEPTYSLPTTGPYDGPTLGMTKSDPGMKLPAPTIGYHWQLR